MSVRILETKRVILVRIILGYLSVCHSNRTRVMNVLVLIVVLEAIWLTI